MTKPKKSVGQRIISSLKKLNKDLKSGKPLKATRLVRRGGWIIIKHNSQPSEEQYHVASEFFWIDIDAHEANEKIRGEIVEATLFYRIPVKITKKKGRVR